MARSTVQQTLTEMVAKIGENMSVRRTVALAVNPGVVAAYVHNAASPELGKIGVLVALKSTADEGKLSAAGQADRHACRRRLAAGADRSPHVQGGGGPRICHPEGSGAAVRQAGSRGREDDGRPDAQIFRRDGAAVPDLRDRRRDPDFQGDRKGVQGFGRAGRRSKALSASRWARASRRSKAISPTKSPRWRAARAD